MKSTARLLIPAAIRRSLWRRFLGDYFEQSSIRAIVHHAKSRPLAPSATVAKLIQWLEQNRYRPNYKSIKKQLGLNFTAFSCQDLIAYIFFNGKANGYFIDIGAFDGVAISNTYGLELAGWNGICVEPIPEVFSLLQGNRNCELFNAAVSSIGSATGEFLKVSKQLGLSGLNHQMPWRIKQGLVKQRLEIEKVTVNTIGFDEVMENHPERTYVDFLSIDVEGGELDVLHNIDFEHYHFGLITIENNAGTESLRSYLRRHGYVIFLDLGIDLMFVPNSQLAANFSKFSA